ncbi:formyl transferase [Mesorhizobium sp. ZMM04-5]|uniref:phosphoribosylglycinamide formyltransferase 1 n=1 Tax=Mesorhizobium marinum TaxID=3228790 RepID=A0ABV3QVQ4_9HYPH
MSAKQSRIAVVTAGGPHVWVIVNALRDRLGDVTVILEEPESKKRLLLRRARKLGWIEVAGQLGTMVFTRLRKLVLSGRDRAALTSRGMNTEPRDDQPIVNIASADSPDLADAVKKLGAEVVLLAGCRMLSQRTLDQMPCPVLNYHAGINPAYRGMNGAYWALATGDAGNFGATVHLVDAGVDTGDILHQVRGAPEPGDNLTNYAMRLAAMSRDICTQAVEDVLEGRAKPTMSNLPSKQWYHPTVWFYVWTGLTRGVW